MTEAVLTPITQALNDGRLTRRELKALMARSDRPALVRLAVWIAVLGVTGTAVWLTLGTIWLVPTMFLHGVVMVHHFSLQHECCHYTAFRTRWLNDVMGNICGFLIMLPHQHFRYEHCDHHTHTQVHGDDPELIEMPKTFAAYLSYISAIPYWRNKFAELGRHIAGRLTPEEERFVPKEVRATIILEARLFLVRYLAILILCAATGWWAPVWFWWLPVLLGEPVMRAIRMTEHVGRPNTRDFCENTRSNLVSRPMQFLCWNMNYHAEHHYAASVPFHALPALHQKLDGYIHVEPHGYLGAHRDILRQIFAPKSPTDAA
ncbi:MAG: fatty acid desaturase [Pseudomonadota bacterium]